MDAVKKEVEVVQAEVVDEFDPLTMWIEQQKWINSVIRQEV